jgi:hypothetical protein
MSKIIPIQEATPLPPMKDMADDKHFVTVQAMAQLARKQPQKNLTQAHIEQVTRRTHMMFIMMPEWGTFFPPYNMARLSAVTRAAGYRTTVMDINIACYNRFRDSETLDYDPWAGTREFHWTGDWYHKELHPYLEPIYLEYLEQIVELNPDVVGFSMYYTSEMPIRRMAQQKKQRLPHTQIWIGGPNAQKPYFKPTDDMDHVFTGEGELIMLESLEKVENGQPLEDRYIRQQSGQRLDLDSLPFPDYSDYDFNLYTIPNGISAEISRGCVAKCTFCAETLFWRYRGRMSGSILDEIEHQYRNHGIDVVWFIDSLVNGNLKELRAFALGVVDRGLNIKWNGYCRCDGRMDAAYYDDLKASGCYLLNYGIESGSQKVLDLMKKGITVDEVEVNLREGKRVGIVADTNWIVGFPNEDPEAFADTMTMIWRNRNNGIRNLATGLTLMLEPETDMGTNPEKYNICKEAFMNTWITTDLSNSQTHRKVRIKSLEIFVQEINRAPITPVPMWTGQRPNLAQAYSITYDDPAQINHVEYEQFDYAIIKPGLNSLADSLVNEIWPLFRLLWRARGGFEMTVTFEQEFDRTEFGHRLDSEYTATHHFKIDHAGAWHADFNYSLKLPKDPWGPWWSAPKHLAPWKDPSFEYHYTGTGQW